MAVLYGLLNRGDTFLGMTLDNGGHLSHGAKFHFSGKEFNALHYGVSRETERIDMDQVRQMAREHRPRLIVTGASSYPRMIDYQAFREICDEVGAYFWVDCAHDCGPDCRRSDPQSSSLCGCGHHVHSEDAAWSPRLRRNPVPGGAGHKNRAGLCFPVSRAGRREICWAARGVLFLELLQPEFKAYANQVCANAKALAQGCKDEGMRLITGGTDTHMVMLDVTPVIESGLEAETLLCSLGIITNKNMIPYDQLPPSTGSGLRIGSPTMTTRGARRRR